MCALMFKSSNRPDGRLKFCLLFAGRRYPLFSRHGHDNVFLDLREYSYRCARSSSKLPIAPMGKWLTCLHRLTLGQLRTLRSTTGGTCHRDLDNFPSPDGRLTFCSLFAGRRCLCRGRHNGHLIVHHQWELSWQCACSCSKVPIGLCWDVLLTRLLRLSLAKLRMLRSTTGGACLRDLAKFPSPRWEYG
jgi:hypothetical protein